MPFLKQLTFKWLKRFWAFIAVKLLIIAVLVTAIRIIIVGANDYKGQAAAWLVAEYNINISVENISAGIDFDGLVLTFNGIDFIDSQVLPFELKLDYLFLHLDFVNSIREQRLVFNRVSLKGANLRIKPQYNSNHSAPQSELTLDSLKSIFLSRLSSFSIESSTLTFTDHLYNKKTIYIQDLSWLNRGDRHQGVGKATLSNTVENNTLEFVVDINGDAEGSNDQLLGALYVNANNLNTVEYLRPQINPLADLKTATVSFEMWSQFDFNGPKNIQLQWDKSQIVWSMLGKYNNFQINDGFLQFTYQDKQWLFDSYDLSIRCNYIPCNDVELSGIGKLDQFAKFDLNGINLNSVMPFYLLFSSSTEAQIAKIEQFEIDGDLKQIGLVIDQPGEFSLSAEIEAFNNQAIGALPGIRDADISLLTNQKSGQAHIKLAPQNINFDGQFSRAMPIKSGDIALSWTNNEKGFELVSEKSVLITDDLETLTQFSLLFPGENAVNKSPFLSLYSYASLNDAEKAQYYFPKLAMGDDVFEYLQPTLKKGSVTGAKIVWYGAFSDYPYENGNGIFQAWVPVKNAQYDFYGEWEGLTDLNLDLLFENDYLLMTGKNAQLGKMNVAQLTGKIDHLNPEGVLTINADIEEDATLISDYLIASPLKDSVGEALQAIHVKNRLSGYLELIIPFESEAETKSMGSVNVLGNDIDIELASDLLLPLKNVQGQFNFINGDLEGQHFSGQLFDQSVDFSFSSKQLELQYKLNGELSGIWDIASVSRYQKNPLWLEFLSDKLEWQGDFEFSHSFAGGYQFLVELESELQGLSVRLPAPYNKNALQSWPAKIEVAGDQFSTKWDARIENKVTLLGEYNYQKATKIIPYLYLGLGEDQGLAIDYSKQVIRINEDKIDFTPWIIKWQALTAQYQGEKSTSNEQLPLLAIDKIEVEIKHALLFGQPMVKLNGQAEVTDKLWSINLLADNLDAKIEYRQGIPDRFDIDIKTLNLPLFEMQSAQAVFSKEDTLLPIMSTNLQQDYAEVFLNCEQCIVQDMQLSPLNLHVFPSESSYSIDYLTLGGEEGYTRISGVWDQQRTNIIIEGKGNNENSIVSRLGYTNPIVYEKSELSGALNWIGAPWQLNVESLNGNISATASDGNITEVDDKGARILSFLSLDGIRRSLNLEFSNVFSKGFGFNEMKMSANITNGIMQNDDYYLEGSAGKITGEGLIDLANRNVNYRFSYSPAVTSSLPVLAAFAINPLTGAAVLMLTKILEPVVDAIIRVDFSVKGSLNDPIVKMENSQQGKIKLQNSEVLEKMGNETSLYFDNQDQTQGQTNEL